MDQEQIRKLLHAASFGDCSKQQRQEILDQLLDAIPSDKSKHEKRGRYDRELIETLFWKISKELPELFPYLFPVFATICGERHGYQLAEIDFNIMRNTKGKLGA